MRAKLTSIRQLDLQIRPDPLNPTSMSELAGKLALVTGGARDIGRAVSIRLAELGATVVINYRARRAEAEETLRMIEGNGGRGLLAPGEVFVAAGPARLVEAGKKTGGVRHDIMLNVPGGFVGP